MLYESSPLSRENLNYGCAIIFLCIYPVQDQNVYHYHCSPQDVLFGCLCAFPDFRRLDFSRSWQENIQNSTVLFYFHKTMRASMRVLIEALKSRVLVIAARSIQKLKIFFATFSRACLRARMQRSETIDICTVSYKLEQRYRDFTELIREAWLIR